MVNECLTTTTDCSAITNFQICYHQGNNTTSSIICGLPVQTYLTFHRHISDLDFTFYITINTYLK